MAILKIMATTNFSKHGQVSCNPCIVREYQTAAITKIHNNLSLSIGTIQYFHLSTECWGLNDKSYNKVVMTGDKKKWGKLVSQDDLKRYEITMRMATRGAVDGYNDVSLDCPIDGCNQKDVQKIIDFTMV